MNMCISANATGLLNLIFTYVNGYGFMNKSEPETCSPNEIKQHVSSSGVGDIHLALFVNLNYSCG